jgi:hypothetical protein
MAAIAPYPRRRGASLPTLPPSPSMMPIYQPPGQQQRTGVGPGGFQGFGNDMFFPPDVAQPQPVGPQGTMNAVQQPGGTGVLPRYETMARLATQPTMHVAQPLTPVTSGGTGGVAPPATPSTSGPQIGNDMFFPPGRAASTAPVGKGAASGRSKGLPADGAPPLFWEPSTPQAAPDARSRGSGQLAAAPNLSSRGNSPLTPPSGRLTNAGGYPHMPFGQGQDANKAMQGGPTIFDVGGNSLHNYGTMDAMGTYQQQQALIAGQLNNRFNQNSRGGANAGGGAMPAYGGGGGGVGGPWQAQMDAANQANDQRYHEINSGYTAARRRADEQLSRLGAMQRQDTNTAYDANASRLTQDTINRGMTNTTVQDNLQQGNTRQRSEAMARLEEALTRERLNTEYSLLRDQLGFMERREDVQPDMGLLAQLAQRAGAAGDGGGGGAVNVDWGGGGGGVPAYGGMGMGMGSGWVPMARGNIQPRGGRGGGSGLSVEQQAEANYRRLLESARGRGNRQGPIVYGPSRRNPGAADDPFYIWYGF